MNKLSAENLRKIAAALRELEAKQEQNKSEKCAQVAIAATGLEILAQKLAPGSIFRTQ
jgi:hypothetical protein